MPDKIEDAIDDVLDSSTDDFAELVQLSGLRPSLDFQNVDLSGVDFGTADLTAFRFKGSSLDGANLTNARVAKQTIDGASLEGTSLPDSLSYDGPTFEFALDEDLRDWQVDESNSETLFKFAHEFFDLPDDVLRACIERYVSGPRYRGQRSIPRAEMYYEIDPLDPSEEAIQAFEYLRDEFANFLYDVIRISKNSGHVTSHDVVKAFHRYATA